MDHTMYKLHPVRWVTPTWEMLISNVENSGIECVQKSEWRQAIEFWRQELGDSFFYNCGVQHPLCNILFHGSFQVGELLDFTSTIKVIKEQGRSNYQFLLAKLKARTKCQNEGIPFVDIARNFFKEGFLVHFLQEKIGQRNADIELIDLETGDSIFIEVSQVNDSQKQSKSWEQFSVISNTFNLYGFDLPVCCKLHHPLNPDELEQVVSKIRELKDKTTYSRRFVFYENDKISMAVAHPAEKAQLDEWCKARKLNTGISGLTGLPAEYDDTERLVEKGKIRKKIKQLPVSKPGFLYIPISFLYWMCMKPPDTMLAIMQEIEEFPDCLGVVLYTSLAQPMGEHYIPVLDSIYSIKNINGVARHLMFVSNPAYSCPINPGTKAKFRRCLY